MLNVYIWKSFDVLLKIVSSDVQWTLAKEPLLHYRNTAEDQYDFN